MFNDKVFGATVRSLYHGCKTYKNANVIHSNTYRLNPQSFQVNQIHRNGITNEASWNKNPTDRQMESKQPSADNFKHPTFHGWLAGFESPKNLTSLVISKPLLQAN